MTLRIETKKKNWALTLLLKNYVYLNFDRYKVTKAAAFKPI